MNDFISTMSELPARHSGVLFEQLNQASMSTAFYMRAMGLALPGDKNIPTHGDVYRHLSVLTNFALESYFKAKDEAPAAQAANEIWGEETNELFSIAITGISAHEVDGYTLTIDLNILYR